MAKNMKRIHKDRTAPDNAHVLDSTSECIYCGTDIQETDGEPCTEEREKAFHDEYGVWSPQQEKVNDEYNHSLDDPNEQLG